jgi:predicted membrane chloride channel (bestrophin family)
VTIPATLFVAFVLLGIEEIGVEIEDPFGTDDNGLPLEAFRETIRRNVEEMAGTPEERSAPSRPSAFQPEPGCSGHNPFPISREAMKRTSVVEKR